jgi:hypothetical protein
LIARCPCDAADDSQASLVSWQDEQHDQQQSLRKSEFEQTLIRIDRFNRSQDPDDLQ